MATDRHDICHNLCKIITTGVEFHIVNVLLIQFKFKFFQRTVSEVLDSVRGHRKDVVGKVTVFWNIANIQTSENCVWVREVAGLLNHILNSIAKVSIDTLTDERIPIDLEKHLTLERISLQSYKNVDF